MGAGPCACSDRTPTLRLATEAGTVNLNEVADRQPQPTSSSIPDVPQAGFGVVEVIEVGVAQPPRHIERFGRMLRALIDVLQHDDRRRGTASVSETDQRISEQNADLHVDFDLGRFP